MKSNNSERAIFTALKKTYPNYTPSPGFLRVEQVLKNQSGSYLFDIKDTSGYSVTENKLDRNDLFVVTSIGIFLLREETAAIGKNVLQTYPNKVEFGTDREVNPDHLEAIYNGKFSLKIGSLVNIEALSMQQFRRVPQTQQSSTDNKSQYSVEGGVYHLPTLLSLKGTMDVQPKVEFPTFDGIKIQSQTAGVNNKLVFQAFGFLLKGAAAASK